MDKIDYYKQYSRNRRNKRKSKTVENKLTARQELFCQSYINNLNATQSYVNVYGCKYNSARTEASKLMANPNIKAEIARLKQIKKESIMLNEDDIIDRYMRIAFSDMTDFVDWGATEKIATDTFGKPIFIINEKTGKKENLKEKVNYIQFKNSNMVDGGIINQVKQGKDGATIKLEDRQKALDWLSKYFLMNPLDKHKIDFDKHKMKIDEENLKINKNESSKINDIKIEFVGNENEDS